MIVALDGEDLYSKGEEIKAFLKKTLGDRVDDPMASAIIYATDPQIPSIAEAVIEACDTVSMFAEEQVVVLRQADSLKVSDQKIIADWLSTKPECTLLIEATSFKSKCTHISSALKKIKVSIQNFPLPKPWEIEKWITNLCYTRWNKRIESPATHYLADALGEDTANIVSELEKILMSHPEISSFTEDILHENIVSQRTLKPNEIQMPFGERNPQQYVQKLHELIEAPKIGATPIIYELYNYATKLLHVNAMLDKGIPEKEIAEKLGINHYVFFIKGNITRHARNWKTPILIRLLKRLAEIDLEIKSGKHPTRISQELALAALVIPPR